MKIEEGCVELDGFGTKLIRGTSRPRTFAEYRTEVGQPGETISLCTPYRRIQGEHIELTRTIPKAPFEWSLRSTIRSPQLVRLHFDNLD